MHSKLGVDLTGCNTTGPLSRAAVACCPPVSYVAYASVTDADRRRQTPATVTSQAPPTLCVGGPVIIWDVIYAMKYGIIRDESVPYRSLIFAPYVISNQ